jgi:hypothetical protein
VLLPRGECHISEKKFGGVNTKKSVTLTWNWIRIFIRVLGYESVLDVAPADPVSPQQHEGLPLKSCGKKRRESVSEGEFGIALKGVGHTHRAV